MKLIQLFITDHMEIELCTNSLFISLPYVGQVFKAKGEKASWDSWKAVKRKR